MQSPVPAPSIMAGVAASIGANVETVDAGGRVEVFNRPDPGRSDGPITRVLRGRINSTSAEVRARSEEVGSRRDLDNEERIQGAPGAVDESHAVPRETLGRPDPENLSSWIDPARIGNADPVERPSPLAVTTGERVTPERPSVLMQTIGDTPSMAPRPSR